MTKTNAEWHRKNRMPSPATMEERIRWHVAHQRVCACRPIPPTVLAAMSVKRKNGGPRPTPKPAARRRKAPRMVGVLLALAFAPTVAWGQPGSSAVRSGFEPAFPEIQRIAESFAQRAHLPGAAVGVIVNGVLVFDTGIGVRDRATNAAVTPESIFRIASMTKSFTAAAILKLRDEGRLALDDAAEKYVPELASLKYPTADSPRITIRHLLSHSEGFPEDNPWGDRQLARPDAVMSDWMRAGIPFSTSPGTAYEYSNYGFAILGQIVARVSGQPYETYLANNILTPLGMTSSTLDVSAVTKDRIARGYRWTGDTWADEELLPHGSFGAMGGLWTSTRDLAKWVAFLLDGFPPRDDADRGPLRRASVREMQQVWRSTRGSALQPSIDGVAALNAGGYGFGLRIGQTCTFGHLVAHGGGLPGYGSQMQWLPDYGVGIITMGNVTYAGWGGAVAEMWTALAKTGALQPRRVTPSPTLLEQQHAVSTLIARWDDRLASKIAADNLFMDESADARRTALQQIAGKLGSCRPSDRIDAENALRGTWRMACDRGSLDVAITLAPTMPPTVQYLSMRPVLAPSAALSNAAATVAALVSSWDEARAKSAAAETFDVARLRQLADVANAEYGACRVGEHVDGDGTSRATVRFACDRGTLTSTIAIDPKTNRLTTATLAPAVQGVCAAR